MPLPGIALVRPGTGGSRRVPLPNRGDFGERQIDFDSLEKSGVGVNASTGVQCGDSARTAFAERVDGDLCGQRRDMLISVYERLLQHLPPAGMFQSIRRLRRTTTSRWKFDALLFCDRLFRQDGR